jgi:integrase
MVRGVPHFPKCVENAPRTGFLEQCDYEKLKEQAHELWLRGLLAAYYSFGFRRAELLNLRVHQINLHDRTINLPSGGTKNGKPRTVVMTLEVRGLVTALIEGKPPEAYVFTRPDGKQVKDFRETWKQMFAAAGVAPRKLHDMRRSAVRNAIRRGIDRDLVKKLSGHLTDDVFSRYNIIAVDDLRDAAKKIEEGAAILRAAQTDTETDTVEKVTSGAGKLVQ